jgi:hypothetical protein
MIYSAKYDCDLKSKNIKTTTKKPKKNDATVGLKDRLKTLC